MNLALITAKQVVVLFILIMSGFVCVKTKAVKIEGKKAFSDLLLYLVVPAMIIHSYIMDFNEEILTNLVRSLVLSTILMIIGIVVTLVITMKVTSKDLPILRFACMFSNAAYMGFPLIQALFGSEGLLYASVYVTIFNILLWTVGYAMVSRKVNAKEVLHTILTTPVIISVVIGLIIYLCRIPVPSVIEQLLNIIGNMNTPLSMFITGMLIASGDVRSMLKNREIMMVIAIRMFLIPAISFAVFALLGVKGMVPEVVLLLQACPSAAITSVFAVQFEYNEETAAGSVVLTTLLSIITLPACAMLLTMMMR